MVQILMYIRAASKPLRAMPPKTGWEYAIDRTQKMRLENQKRAAGALQTILS